MSTSAVHDSYDFGGTGNPISRLLWWCAAADPQIIAQSPNSDRVKLQGIGGMVLATGIIAFISGAYAFYTVFSPKDGTALAVAQQNLDWPSFIYALMFGLLWALIIFNIDRFIVGSTGKGDGTDAITLSEFVRALPRIAMATVIGICLSAPLEIRVLKTEIEGTLESEQQAYLASLNTGDVEIATAEARKAELRAKIDAAQGRIDERDAYFEKRRGEILDQRKQLEREAEGLSASGKAGRGPAWRDKSENLVKLESEMGVAVGASERKRASAEAQIAEWNSGIQEADRVVAAEKDANAKLANSQDGLLKRIQISHRIGGVVPVFIALLLLCIEVGPIFFKMMVTKGAYDYLEEDRKFLILARAGIEHDARIMDDDKNKTRHIDKHHAAKAVLQKELGRFATEARLSDEVRLAFEKDTKEDIAQHLDKYLAEKPGEV